MKKVLLVIFIFISICLNAQHNLNLLPMPADIQMDSGDFILNKNTTIIFSHGDKESLKKIGDNLNDYLFTHFRFRLKQMYRFDMMKDKRKNKIEIGINWLPKNSKENRDTQLYTLKIDSNISLTGSSFQNLFYGIQTLIQLLPIQKESVNQKNYQLSIPQLSIKDYPRFQYRGMHLDVCRHFMPIDLVKKYIDYLAMYKFNTFHWHLTEDQGWRIEIKKYPKLTEVGGWRNGTIIGAYPGTGNDSIRYGGYYTQEQIKEVIKYAADRYITIIPEIELPGHSSAAIAAYPGLSCFPNEDTKYPSECVWAGPTKGKQVQQTWGVFEDVFCPSEYTFKFLEDVLDEVIALFPSQYIHIGGDECPKESWKRSAFCQQLMKEKGLRDEHELQSYFIQRIEKYINSKGKKIIGWDEILEGGLAPNATVMSWRGEAGGIAAAKQHHDVIMTPEYPLYINHSQTKNEDSVTQGGYNPLDAVYNYEPIPKELTEEEGKYVLGAQGNVWSEYIGSRSKLEYTLFPRMAALAEVLWTPKEKRNWKDFERRLPVILERLDKQKINYSKAYYQLESKVFPANNFDGVVWAVKSIYKKGAIFLDANNDEVGKWIISETKLKADNLFKISETLFVGDLYFLIKGNNEVRARLYNTDSLEKNEEKNWEKKPGLISVINQLFHFNKATGKKITLSAPADEKYPGDGAFTLVNGIQSTAGLSKSSEYLGFNGKDCEAVIDLGKTGSISKVIVHALNQNGDWIWRPASVEVFISDDGINFISAGKTMEYSKKENATGSMTVNFNPAVARFVKVSIINNGLIPAGNSGSGNPAWLFVDEIEVE